MRRASIAVAIAALATVAGATIAAVPTDTVQFGERAYTIGQETEAFVGEPLIKSKTWAVDTAKVEGFTNDIPFTFKFSLAPSPGVHFPAGTEMRAEGKDNHAGKVYTLVRMPVADFANNLLMLDENNLFVGLVKNRRKVVSAGANIFISATPQRVQFTPKTITKASVRGMSTNREIIYSGKTRDAINLLYREYTENDLARPAFSQNLVYEPDISMIRFRDIEIRVVSVDGEKIRFIVEKDGIGDEPGVLSTN